MLVLHPSLYEYCDPDAMTQSRCPPPRISSGSIPSLQQFLSRIQQNQRRTSDEIKSLRLVNDVQQDRQKSLYMTCSVEMKKLTNGYRMTEKTLTKFAADLEKDLLDFKNRELRTHQEAISELKQEIATQNQAILHLKGEFAAQSEAETTLREEFPAFLKAIADLDAKVKTQNKPISSSGEEFRSNKVQAPTQKSRCKVVKSLSSQRNCRKVPPTTRQLRSKKVSTESFTCCCR